MSKKILMALMGLEIGGAETHVVELSKELHRRGYEVVVVSNGGVYERELVEAGIRCHRAPLHKRSLGAMFRSLVALRRIIREEKPDVVHAHARIPAFL
ncbi:MAG: glycosyltransferase, partial [Oscillospiraceae bacterium]|nr:glycosyltransferase [Oscillospiraceae bacterium]